MVAKLAPALLQVRASIFAHSIDDAFVPKNADIGRSDRARSWVACVGHAMGKLAAFVDKDSNHVIGNHDPADRQVA